MLAFIRAQIAEHGISPSYAEIRDEFDLESKSKVYRIVLSLERRGLISRDINRWGRKGQRVLRLR